MATARKVAEKEGERMEPKQVSDVKSILASLSGDELRQYIREEKARRRAEIAERIEELERELKAEKAKLKSVDGIGKVASSAPDPASIPLALGGKPNHDPYQKTLGDIVRERSKKRKLVYSDGFYTDVYDDEL